MELIGGFGVVLQLNRKNMMFFNWLVSKIVCLVECLAVLIDGIFLDISCVAGELAGWSMLEGHWLREDKLRFGMDGGILENILGIEVHDRFLLDTFKT